MKVDNIFNLMVSYQNSVSARLSKNITVNESLKYIKDGRYKKQIELLRSYISSGDLEGYNLNKTRLPAVTFSATFNGARNGSSIETYNSLLVLDIDELSEERLLSLKGKFVHDEHVLAFWESPSKTGIKGLIYLEYDSEFKDKDLNECHGYAFKLVSKYFFETHGVELDNSGSDIPRLCFFSEDENLFQRETGKPIQIVFKKAEFHKTSVQVRRENIKFSKQTSRNKKFNPSGKNDPQNRYIIKSITTYLQKGKKSITQDYNRWFQVALAISNTFTYEIGLKYFLNLSKLDLEKYDEDNCTAMMEYCYHYSKGAYTFATIVYFAKLEGYKEKVEVPKVEVVLWK